MPVIAVNVTLNTTDPIPRANAPRKAGVQVRFFTTDGSTVTISFTSPPGSPFSDCGNSFDATGAEGRTCTVDTSTGLGVHGYQVTADGKDPRDGDIDIKPGD